MPDSHEDRRCFAFHQQCLRVSTSSRLCQHFLFSEILKIIIIAILVGAKWHLFVVVVFISLRTDGVERCFMSILAICHNLWLDRLCHINKVLKSNGGKTALREIQTGIARVKQIMEVLASLENDGSKNS